MTRSVPIRSTPSPLRRRSTGSGTDNLGLDIYSRVVAGARIDFVLALIGVLLGGGLGSMMGAWPPTGGAGWTPWCSGWWRYFNRSRCCSLGWYCSRPSVPWTSPGTFDTGVVVLVIAIAFVNFPSYVRQVRSVLIPFTDAEFVQAARCSGLGGWGIVWKHFIPNARGQILALFALTCAYAIQIIAGLSFIGLGIEPPNPSGVR